MNDASEYPFHKGARGAYYIVAVLLIVLIITTPVALYLFFRIGRAKVIVSRTGVREEGVMFSSGFNFDDIERLGLLKIPIGGAGIGVVIANMKLGGLGYGLNVVVKTKSGKNLKFISNQYERHEEMIEKIKQATPAKCEDLEMGAFTWKWPERTA